MSGDSFRVLGTALARSLTVCAARDDKGGVCADQCLIPIHSSARVGNGLDDARVANAVFEMGCGERGSAIVQMDRFAYYIR